MKIIALAGAYNSGKTTILKQLTTPLRGMGARLLARVTHGSDEQCALSFNGKIVGVCSGGDNADVVRDNFAFFSANNCTVGISACRSVSECASVDAMKACAWKLGRQLPFYVGKMREKNRRAAVDAQTVQQIIAMI